MCLSSGWVVRQPGISIDTVKEWHRWHIGSAWVTVIRRTVTWNRHPGRTVSTKGWKCLSGTENNRRKSKIALIWPVPPG